MKFYSVSDYDALCRKAAALISAQIHVKPGSAIAWPTGSTPVGVYAKLVDLYQRGELDFSQIKSFNLDEYLGLSNTAPQSFAVFMDEQLFSKVNIPVERRYMPNATVADISAECTRYEALIDEAGGLDLVFLGIGTNGHIAFNEPEPTFSIMTHCANLSEGSIQACANAFGGVDKVPRQAITMGIKTIMRAKKILLTANGPGKKDIMHRSFYEPITPDVPASILQLHPDLTVVWSDN